MENYKFDMLNENEWKRFLDEYGFVVISNVIDGNEVMNIRNGYWDHFEVKYEDIQLKRDNPRSWINWSIDSRGITLEGSIIHCQAAWDLRTHPNVKQIFSNIWKTDNLLVSMDSTLIWLPNYDHYTEGLHLDENPFYPFEHSLPDGSSQSIIQGMIPLSDITSSSGGLEVVPLSHTFEEQNNLKEENPRFQISGHFCVIRNSKYDNQTLLLEASAGDMILWSSRTIHGGKLGTNENTNSGQLIRLSQTICMTPATLASKDTIKRRIMAFESGIGCNHIPHEYSPTTRSSGKDYNPPILTDAHRTLIYGQDYTI